MRGTISPVWLWRDLEGCALLLISRITLLHRKGGPDRTGTTQSASASAGPSHAVAHCAGGRRSSSLHALSVVRRPLLRQLAIFGAGLLLALDASQPLEQLVDQPPLADDDLVQLQRELLQVRGLDLEHREPLLVRGRVLHGAQAG